MVQEILVNGDCVRVITPVQTPKQKKDHIEKDIKKRIRQYWAERRQYQKELDVLKESLRGISKKTQRTEYNNIRAQIEEIQGKITSRENIIHDDIKEIKNEENWLKHEKEKDQKLRKMLRAKRAEIEKLNSRTR